MRDAVHASGAELVTVALRRVDTTTDDDILGALDLDRLLLLTQHQRRDRRR